MIRRNALLAAIISIFVCQAIASHALRREPFLPSPPSLARMPLTLGDWQWRAEEAVPPESLDMLGPDDYLAREYRLPDKMEEAELFVAYYKTQIQPKNAHDPKVCLPGAGWNPVESRLAQITVPNSGIEFPVNYYRIRKDESDEVVLYWFQTLNGVYTFEQQLRAHRILDAIVHNRTDMALVRIVVPVTEKGVAAADASAIGFAQSVYTSMLPYFPPTEKTGS